MTVADPQQQEQQPQQPELPVPGLRERLPGRGQDRGAGLIATAWAASAATLVSTASTAATTA